MRDDKTYNVHDTLKDGRRHSAPSPHVAVEFLWCNNADIQWYGRMTTDPPLIDLKGEKLPGQCEEEDATLEAINHVIDNQPPH